MGEGVRERNKGRVHRREGGREGGREGEGEGERGREGEGEGGQDVNNILRHLYWALILPCSSLAVR